MKMKIIDLLNKIANGEKTPEKIKYQNKIFVHNGFGNNNYWCEEKKETFEECFILEDLNDEVEIIEEEKEIEKFITDCCIHDIKGAEHNINLLKEKINELVDAVNELKRGN